MKSRLSDEFRIAMTKTVSILGLMHHSSRCWLSSGAARSWTVAFSLFFLVVLLNQNLSRCLFVIFHHLHLLFIRYYLLSRINFSFYHINWWCFVNEIFFHILQTNIANVKFQFKATKYPKLFIVLQLNVKSFMTFLYLQNN